MATPRVDEPARCAGCAREVEVCGFCGEACGVEICYRCTLVELKETRPQPHPHGG
ncbi:MAG: hypothetical protein ACRDI0_05530 [Actinomycetota bacterium]